MVIIDELWEFSFYNRHVHTNDYTIYVIDLVLLHPGCNDVPNLLKKHFKIFYNTQNKKEAALNKKECVLNLEMLLNPSV